MVEEQCLQQLQEGLNKNFKSLAIGVAVCPWENNSSMLNEEGSGKDVVEEPQKHNLHLPSTDLVYLVYVLPSPAAHSTPKTPTAKGHPIYIACPAKPQETSGHFSNLRHYITNIGNHSYCMA